MDRVARFETRVVVTEVQDFMEGVRVREGVGVELCD